MIRTVLPSRLFTKDDEQDPVFLRMPDANESILVRAVVWIITTFRLKKRTVAEADVIEEALALGSRTNALQFAVEQVFNDLHKRCRSMTRAEIDRDMRRGLQKLGG